MKFSVIMKQCCIGTSLVLMLVSIILIGAGITIFIQFGSALSIGSESFLGTGALFFEYGLILFTFGSMTITSMNAYAKREGFWTGKKFTFLCIIVDIALLVYSAYVVYGSYNYYTPEIAAVHDLDTSDDLTTVAFVKGEHIAGEYFNILFFTAASNCKLSADWFWTWVESNCPSTMSASFCQRCYSYSLSFCPADESLCQDPTDQYCPYTLCRTNALDFFANRLVWSIMLAAAIMVVIHFILFLFLSLLLCSTVKDKAVLKVVPLTEENDHAHEGDAAAYENEVARALLTDTEDRPAMEPLLPATYIVEEYEHPSTALVSSAASKQQEEAIF